MHLKLRHISLAMAAVTISAALGAAPGLVPGLIPDMSNDGQPIALPAPSDAKGNYAPPPESRWPADGKRGELIEFTYSASKIYPGTENPITIYVPSAYTGETPACLYLKLDGIGIEPPVFENLIARHEMPVTIIVGVGPGVLWKDKAAKTIYRYNRTYEFDSTNDNFPNFLETELLPAVERQKTARGLPIRISRRPQDRAIGGGSTGGIGAFTVAWRRPDLFSRVFSTIGTFVAMRGGDQYPALIRKTEPKPIRIFLEDGNTDAWNPLFGSWYIANLNMDAALRFAGYDEAHLWGSHGHDARLSAAILPDVMRWLWKGWPEPVAAGTSHNDTLRSILSPGSGWEREGGDYGRVGALAANGAGEVAIADNAEITGPARPSVAPDSTSSPIHGLAFGPDGELYASEPDADRIVAWDRSGRSRIVTTGIRAEKLTVNSHGECFATEPGPHSDDPSRIWLIGPDGTRVLLDRGISSASGLALSPDGSLLLAAEPTSQWIYSFALMPDNTLADKQRYFWLHVGDLPENSGAREMAYDTLGNLFVASRTGIQVCDTNGRVRAILTVPTSRPVLSLCFGGPDFSILYASDGVHVFRRRLAVHGYRTSGGSIARLTSGPG